MDNTWLGLKGKSVIVTGGASGIGLACVHEFLNDGAYVAVCDINPAPPKIDAGSNGGKYIYVRCDVTNLESVNAMVNTVVSEFGTIDILVNNAGINIPRRRAGAFRTDMGQGHECKRQGTVLLLAGSRSRDGKKTVRCHNKHVVRMRT